RAYLSGSSNAPEHQFDPISSHPR
ncbi:hypothetical protein Pmar_PMAR015408, partial [Perkinsus marinus ATCC 50983]